MISRKEITSILEEIGFEENPHHDIYTFYQKYPCEENLYGSCLYVSFEDYNGKYFTHFNCHNFQNSVDINNIESVEKFLEHLDNIVLCGKDAWIYSDPIYNIYGSAATEQRKRYFDVRSNSKYEISKDILNIIESEGLDIKENIYDIEYNGKRIGDMNVEELSMALVKEIKK